jgi:replicative DNA helicase
MSPVAPNGSTQTPLYRVAPHNIEVEQALLGAILVNNEAFLQVSDYLKAFHFFEPIHQKIFDVASCLIGEGKIATPITLKDFLPADIDIAGLTVNRYLARLAAEATTVINAFDYGRTIFDLAIRRDLIRIGEETVNNAYDAPPDARPEDQIEEVERQLYELNVGTHNRTSCWAYEAVDDVIDCVTKTRMGQYQPATIKTGLIDLDKATGGFKPGDLVIVAGRPGMGKTIFGASIARICAVNGYGVLFHSLEMARDQIAARILADQAFNGGDSQKPISANQIQSTRLSDSEHEHLVLAARELQNLPLKLDVASSLTVAQIASRARKEKTERLRRNQSLDLLVIDYLKLVKPASTYKGQRQYEIGEITAALKVLAKELDLCVMLLAQVNREPERRDDKRPHLSDLRDSGDLEADADMVLLLFREAYYLETNKNAIFDAALMSRLDEIQFTLEINVAKNRQGPTRVLEVFCRPGSGAVRNRLDAHDR